MKKNNPSLFDEMFIDNFAGGGGASTGIELAIGRPVDIAINHDKNAIAMHKANHPFTKHYCESVWDVDPLEATGGRQVAMCWLSPDCTHFSKAKGGKPVKKEIRGLAWIALKWASAVKPRVIMLENVEEFKTWGPLKARRDKKTKRIITTDIYEVLDPVTGKYVEENRVANKGEVVPFEKQLLEPDKKKSGKTFRLFKKALENLGYHVEYTELKACDYGAPTTRKRFFLVARCDGEPIVFPESTHAPRFSEEVKNKIKQPYVPAKEIIDWTLPTTSIFERKRPLAEATMKRIARGIFKYVINDPEPFILQMGQTGFTKDRNTSINEPINTIVTKQEHCVVTPTIMTYYKEHNGSNIEEPISTITGTPHHALVAPYMMINNSNHSGNDLKEPVKTITSGNHHALITPTLLQMGYPDSEGKRVLDLENPLGAVTSAGNKFGLAVSTMIQTGYGENKKQNQKPRILDLKEPLNTVVSTTKQGLVTAFIEKTYGGNYLGSGSDVQNPLDTVTAVDHNRLCELKMEANGDALNAHEGEVKAFLIKYYNQAIGQSLEEPLHTIGSRDTFGLVTIKGTKYKIVDIGLRMLEPHELYAAHGFPKDYEISKGANGKELPKYEKVKRVGNSVPPAFAEALVKANLPEYAVDKKIHTMAELNERIAYQV
ncbi:DNA cytosine methyltransferase [Breznakia pachnodae]|uniref:DNA (cytosine-5-)-methyltransferase n=1 Tax=Breznakia pachnodae TaxID=265178 RepID=A0ABU0E3Z6_9FIRM|nr:DNA cytosine methyltransferase [Breznakia pachnodae]MDQ0361622.1 DNA (cytosine-5)-methyltransferase 1 [Breznakia pachnodae]